MCDVERLKRFYWQLHHKEPVIVRSPGRINLIGEHTDYNEGFVLPAAIDKAIFVAAGERTDNDIYLHAAEYNENYVANVDVIQPSKFHWSNYILGIVDQLQKTGFSFPGFNLIIDGDVPVGAGMAASAAIECATVFALNEIFGLGLSKLEMVKIAQQAEQEFVGLQCGIMDMFSSMYGKKDNVIKLDCRSLEYEYVPFYQEGIKIVLLDTSVKHSLASSEYNTRRKQCEEGVAFIQQHHPQVQSLRDTNLKMLDECVPKNSVAYNRCKYVIEENERLLAACNDLQKNDIISFGKKMFKTHDGLSKLYEVSCSQLDLLVKLVKREPAVIGARMMGGGFGGCTINLIKEDAVEEIIYTVRNEYRNKTGMNLNAYMAAIQDGANMIEKFVEA